MLEFEPVLLLQLIETALLSAHVHRLLRKAEVSWTLVISTAIQQYSRLYTRINVSASCTRLLARALKDYSIYEAYTKPIIVSNSLLHFINWHSR